MSSTRNPSAPRASRDLIISHWPLRDEGWRAWLLLALSPAVGVGVYALVQHPLPAGLAATAVFLSLWRLWIPVRFVLGPGGITQTILGRRQRVSWRSFGGYRRGTSGVLLQSSSDAPLNAHQGLFVGWGGQRDEVLAMIERYLPRERHRVAQPDDSTNSLS